MNTLVETVDRHQIHLHAGKYYLFTPHIGTWGFDFPTLEEARRIAESVN